EPRACAEATCEAPGHIEGVSDLVPELAVPKHKTRRFRRQAHSIDADLPSDGDQSALICDRIEMRSGVNSEVRHWVSEPGLIDELGSIWTKAKWKWFLVEKKVTDAFDLIEVSPKGQVDEDLGFFCRMVTDPRVPQWRDDTTEISEHFLLLCTDVRREHLLSEHRGDPR